MRAEHAARSRIVLLPGALEPAAAFEAAGFRAAVAARDLPLDLEFAELEIRDVADRSVLERLLAGPLTDARRAGCRTVWLGGVSFGAFLSVACADRFRGSVDGLCLIAPYLGTRLASSAIARAGGLSKWRPAAGTEHDEDLRAWRFLGRPSAERCPIFLGYGREDRFADSQVLLAQALAADAGDAVAIVEGGHDWTAWRAAWESFLACWPRLDAGVRVAGSV